jgi:hypothetical protein
MKRGSRGRAVTIGLCLLLVLVLSLGLATAASAAAPPPPQFQMEIDPSILQELMNAGITLEADAPVVEDVEPNGGLTTGGEEVVITGLNFVSVTEVSFGGTPVPEDDYEVVSTKEIRASAPMHAPGSVQVMVVTAFGGESPDTSADDYTYIAAPATTAAPTTAAPTTAAPTTEPPTTAGPTETTMMPTTTIATDDEGGGGLSGGWIAFIVVIAVVVVGGMGTFVYRLGKKSK